VQGFDHPKSAAWETEELFAECRDSLIRYLRYHLDDVEEAEDLAQESFLRFFETRSRNEQIEQPKAWLFRVARNLLVDRGRKKKPELLDQNGWAKVERRLTASPASIDTKIYLSQLPWGDLSPMELECLRLRTEGLKLREVGEVLNLTISSVVSYLARAAKKLGAVEGDDKSTSKHGRTPAAV
jgi:RNA polymerase sigma-70 factor (ECF subfamily)